MHRPTRRASASDLRPHRLPPLNSLRAFEVAARHLSMSGAAEELGVTQGAVSRQVINLERFLGLELFHRHPLGMSLTDHGSRYYAMLGVVLQQLYVGHAVFVRGVEANVLKIKLPPTFTMRWLIPRLQRLHA